MADLIGRLRAFEGSDELGNGDFSLLTEAATEIEKLRAEVERLRTEAEQHFQQAMSNGAKARAAQANNLRAEVEALREEIGRLLDSREREGDRLDWLLARLPRDVIRDLVGEMSCTSDVGEWRDRIDKAARFKPPNPALEQENKQ